MPDRKNIRLDPRKKKNVGFQIQEKGDISGRGMSKGEQKYSRFKEGWNS